MPPKKNVKPVAKASGPGGAGQARQQQPVELSAQIVRKKAVALTLDVEAEIRALIKELDSKPATTAVATRPLSTAAAVQKATRQLTAVFDALVSVGFSPPWIHQALQSLPLVNPTLDGALDWLCLYMPTEELPQRFAAGARAGTAGQDVKLIAKAQEQAPAKESPAPPTEDAAAAPSHGSHAQNGAGGGRGAQQGGANAGTAKAAQPDDRASSKAWILQQYAGGSSDESGHDSDGSAASSDTELATMALWADPREVARRRQERASAKVPPEVRRQQLAHEYAKAKEAAGQAKTAGDAARKKECGALIRDLKAEMQQVGLGEEEALELVTPKAAAGAPAAATGGDADDDAFLGDLMDHLQMDVARAATPAATAALQSTPASAPAAAAWGAVSGQGADGELGDVPDEWDAEVDDDGGADPVAPMLLSAVPPASGPSPPAAAPEDEDWGLGMFEGEVQWDAPTTRTAIRYDDNALAQWGIAPVVAAPAGAKRRPKPAAAAPQDAARQPKALLAQYCQRQGLAQPRYTRLSSKSAEGTVVYSVTLDLGNARGAAKKRGLAGVRTFRLPGDHPEEDGAAATSSGSNNSGIADGQNGAAVRALWELLGGEQPLHHILVDPFRAWWMRWDSADDSERLAGVNQVEQDKMDFIRSLLAADGAARPAANAAAAAASVAAEAAAASAAVAAATVAAAATAAATAQPDSAAAQGSGWDSEDEIEDSAPGQWLSPEQQELDHLAQDSAEPDAAPAPLDARPTATQQAASAVMSDQLRSWRSSPAGAAMQGVREGLPISAIREALLCALQSSDVVVVSGDTGCGKTTQVPQYILEQATLAGRGAQCSVIVTQPRRIAAISVAERVASERGEPLPGSKGRGDEAGWDGGGGAAGASRGRRGHVGYHVRLDAATTRDTRLLFCTTGILLRRLAGDRSLSSITHIVVDEVHERTLQGDFLVALLRELIAARRALGAPLKVILMSATIDATRFAAYFGVGTPTLAAAGRTFPVTPFFLEDVYSITDYRLAPDASAALRHRGPRALSTFKKQAGGNEGNIALLRDGWGDEEADAGPLNADYDASVYAEYPDHVRRNLARVNEDALDYDLMEALVTHIDQTMEPGAILVFLPGLGEIRRLLERLNSTRHFAQGGHWLLPLHSSVSQQDQRAAFKVPPPGVRKIVICTDIAETSLTIEDVVYVVDSGKHKERRYEARRRMSLLVEDWVSRASSLQRRGRAGRVRPGTCFALFTQQRWEHGLRQFGQPEIMRVPLEELVLQIHLLHLGPAAQFLAKVLEPPAANAITAALDTLQQVGALTRGTDDGSVAEALTPLGHHLAQLPLEPRLGKLLLLGAALGCLSPALTMAAVMSHRSPFATPLERRDEADRARRALAVPGAKTLAAGQQSDHLLMVAAYSIWHAARVRGGDRAAAQVARDHFLDAQALQALSDMRNQFASILSDVKFVGPPALSLVRGQSAWVDDMTQPWNKHSQQAALVKAVLCAALAPNVGVMSDASVQHQAPRWLDAAHVSRGPPAAGNVPVAQAVVEEVVLHPSCLAAGLMTSQVVQPFLVFHDKMKTSQVFLRDVTPVSPLALLLLGGSLHVMHEEGSAVVAGWVRVSAPAQTAVLIKRLRGALDDVLAAKVRQPSYDLSAPGLGRQVISAIAFALISDERNRQHLQT